MSIKVPFYPIVYIRGFAASMTEIEDTVATPYMGFELGSAKIRQNWEGKVVRYIFESPLIRLMKDEGYVDTFADGDFISEDRPVPVKSIWIFRYYEQASEDLGSGRRQSMLEIAADLRAFILRIRSQVCRDDKGNPNRDASEQFKVYLVAHSMGGLVARCYLQNICRYGTGDPARDQKLALPGGSLVDKVFTYATPHNGIDILGMNAPNLGPLDSFQVKNFNRDEMKDYLAFKSKNTERVDSLDGAFPPERFFCLIGTNYKDYTAFYNLSRRGTGSMSDGLVMVSNAAVEGAPRTFVFRSHSGHFGIVNSEEGYQNLRRFLFGQVRVDVLLMADEITLPANIQEKKDQGHEIRASYHIEGTAQVRGARYFLHERKVDQESALFKKYDEWVKDQRPAYLFSGYLDRRSKSTSSADTALAFSVRVAIKSPEYEVDNKFWFDAHFEGADVFIETITFHVEYTSNETNVRYGLASVHGPGAAPLDLKPTKSDQSGREFEVPLGFEQSTPNPPRPGFRGRLLLRATPWNQG